MKEVYEFMKMPCEFRRPMQSDENEMYPKHRMSSAISPFPEKTPIGMAYVPYQQWGETYSASDGFCRGTIFPELDYPFKGGDCSFE